MEIHGLFGFCYRGKLYLTCSHHDSHPSSLGTNLLNELKEAIRNRTFAIWINLFLELTIVTDENIPSLFDIRRLQPYTKFSNGVMNWYNLTYKCQGSFNQLLQSKYLYSYDIYNLHLSRNEISLIDKRFPFDRINIQYIYILNFDSNTFEYGPHFRPTHIYLVKNLPKNLDIFIENHQAKDDFLELNNLSYMYNIIIENFRKSLDNRLNIGIIHYHQQIMSQQLLYLQQLQLTYLKHPLALQEIKIIQQRLEREVEYCRQRLNQ
jgi:hypothetical protein